MLDGRVGLEIATLALGGALIWRLREWFGWAASAVTATLLGLELGRGVPVGVGFLVAGVFGVLGVRARRRRRRVATK